MRFLNGVVVGVLLAIGVAYWHDRGLASAPDAAAHELVNWQEFGRSVSAAGDWIQAQFAQLSGSLHRRD